MINAIAFILTILPVLYIIKMMRKKKNKQLSRVLSRQSEVHKMMKEFFLRGIFDNVSPSQLTKRKQKGRIRVIVVGNEAYWVAENMFYVAVAFNGEVQPATAKPVDIGSMSNKDIDKMLFILDSLKNGKENDSGSSGNTRF